MRSSYSELKKQRFTDSVKIVKIVQIWRNDVSSHYNIHCLNMTGLLLL